MDAAVQKSDDTTDGATTRVVIHLVHGTWAPDAIWARDGSFFREGLERRLRELQVPATVEFVTPRWDAGNRQVDRISGAERVRAAVREHASRGTRQLLIGHSHGGSLCCLACAPGPTSVASDVAGVVCLSTPFIVFRTAPYMRWVYAASWSAWTMVALAGTGAFAGSFLSFAITTALAFGAWTGLIGWVARFGYDERQVLSPPATLPMPVLLMRSPGDEASGALGATLFFERLMVLTSGRVSAIWKSLDDHPWRTLLLIIVMNFAFALVAIGVVAWWGSLQPLKWPAIATLTVVFIVLVLPLMIVAPLRSLLCALSYGRDVATRGVFFDISAEATPPGAWTVHTILPPRLESGVPSLAHSTLYDNAEAIDVIAQWIRDVLGGGVIAPSIITQRTRTISQDGVAS